jgi:hypothetical protein
MQAAEAAICIFEENTPMMSKRKVTTYREIRSDFTNRAAQALFLPLFLALEGNGPHQNAALYPSAML